MLQRGLCKSIRSIQHDEHKPETRGRSSTSNSIMRKVQRRRRGPELATLQSLNNCYGDLRTRTKVCERTFFFFGFEWRRWGPLLAKKWGPTDLLQRGELRAYIPDKHWPSSQRSNLSLEAILVSPRCLDFPGSRQFCVSRLQKIKISFLEFFTRQK